MEYYFRMQESCLISIMIPLNFAVGDYAIWLKDNGYKNYKMIVDLLLFVIGMGITGYLINEHLDPYIPFIFMGGIVIAIIQNSILIRGREEKQEWYDFEYVLKGFGIVLGFLIVCIPHTTIFYDAILSRCGEEVITICYAIYMVWGIEKIGFNVFSIDSQIRRRHDNE